MKGHKYAKAGIHFKSAALVKLADDRIMLEHTPPTDIKFPLQTGLGWTYRQPTEITHGIDKQVTGTETLKLAGTTFNCYIIEWIWSNSPNNVKMTDWISDKGLIKRTNISDNVTMQNENGQELAFGQWIETLTLKAVEIK